MFDPALALRPNVRRMTAYSSARDEFTGREGIFLDANELPYGALNRYPDPYQKALRGALAKRLDVDVDQVFTGNGSDEVIDLVMRLFCTPGPGKICTISPSYGMYKVSAELNDLDVLEVPLGTDFALPIPELIRCAAAPEVELMFLCSPNNPTGNAFRVEELRQILDAAQCVVVVDEAYAEFSDEISAISLVDAYPNLVVTRTMSKAWGLAAARVGIAISNPQMVQWLMKIKPPYNMSKLNQEAALAALGDAEGYARRLAQVLEAKKELAKALEASPCVVEVFQSDANFLLVRTTNAAGIYERLKDRGVVVRLRDKQVEGCLRITVGRREENERLIEELKGIGK